jgi:glyoxylase-like metal-dependent hydrolase (beta-lactamase superfamily II)
MTIVGLQEPDAPVGSKQRKLADSNDMTPVAGTVDLDIPIDTLWESFRHANFWPRWNKCFFWARNRDLVVGKHLIWCFEPIKPWYPYKMWSIANIVEVEPRRKVTWEVTAFPGMYARHTYHMEDLGNGRTRFGSWEKAMGPGFRIIGRFWLAHFTFVKDRSLEGALQLNEQYRRTRALAPEAMQKKNYVPFWAGVVALVLLLAAAIAAGWFYFSYQRLTSTELAPGVHAVFGGGGNSLVIENGGDAVVVDPKFPPGADRLHDWIAGNVRAPIRAVVNTHYHYDHTQGNALYPEARKIAHRSVPQLMRSFDDDWWSAHAGGVPTDLVDDAERRMTVGSIDLVLAHPPPAHTRGDLFVFLPRQNVVATGDLVFNTYYPFMDQPEGGTSIPGMVGIVRRLADDHPNATFVPGHGPLATAADLRRYADYLEALYAAVGRARSQGLDAEAAASRVDLSAWSLAVLPSFHHRQFIWATRKNNIRWAYALWQGPQA